jgi:hypothetical protein
MDLQDNLLFDPPYLYVIENGKVVTKYLAVSGNPLANGSFDYSAERQKISSIGPIPEGEYSVNMNSTQRWSDLGFIQQTMQQYVDKGRFPVWNY